MATIAENLLALKQIQLDLRTAIEGKGVPVGDAPFAEYPALVWQIVFDNRTLYWTPGDLLYWEGDEQLFWQGEE